MRKCNKIVSGPIIHFYILLVGVTYVQNYEKNKLNTRKILRSDRLRLGIDSGTHHKMIFSSRNYQYWPGQEIVRVRQIANMAASLIPNTFICEALTAEAPRQGWRAYIRGGVTKIP